MLDLCCGAKAEALSSSPTLDPSLAPQPPHRALSRSCFPWSERLTASFATRGPRVQIPSAPLNRLVRALSALRKFVVVLDLPCAAPRGCHRMEV